MKKLLRNVLRSSWIQRAVGFLAAEFLRLVLPPDADAETMERLRVKLEANLNEATRRAYAQVGRPEQAGHG